MCVTKTVELLGKFSIKDTVEGISNPRKAVAMHTEQSVVALADNHVLYSKSTIACVILEPIHVPDEVWG